MRHTWCKLTVRIFFFPQWYSQGGWFFLFKTISDSLCIRNLTMMPWIIARFWNRAFKLQSLVVHKQTSFERQKHKPSRTNRKQKCTLHTHTIYLFSLTECIKCSWHQQAFKIWYNGIIIKKKKINSHMHKWELHTLNRVKLQH